MADKNKQLDKTLIINKESYEVNAVYSDEAGCTTKSLKLSPSGEDSDTYNGSKEKEIKYVSSEYGGSFEGAIKVPNNEPENLKANPTTVLNFADITALVSKLTGAMWYSWNGTELSAVSAIMAVESPNQSGSTGSTNNSPKALFEHMAVIVGKSSEINSFENYNSSNSNTSKFSLYLYVSNDEIGDLFLGGASEVLKDNNSLVFPLQLAHRATSIYSSSNNKTMSAQEIFNYISNYGTRLTNAESTIDNHTARLTNVETKASSNKTTINNIINGNQIVGNAKNASSANSATNDSTNRQINLNYYRTYSPYTTKTNSIRIQNTKPEDSVGELGDICIVY